MFQIKLLIYTAFNTSLYLQVLTLYVRAGCDNKKYGACPFCQRIFMVLIIKAASSEYSRAKGFFSNISIPKPWERRR